MLMAMSPVLEQHAVRRTFGIVFQDPSLDDELTAFENMELHGVLYKVASPKRRERIEMLLKFVELWDRQGHVVKQFSGGMKRRLEIARALLHDPKIIFLDEPTLGLDPQTRNHIWSYIKKFECGKKKVTVFFTTHYMEEADRVADKLAVIDHGKIVAEGTPQSLKEKAKARSLEDAFIALTGRAIRDEGSSATDHMRTALENVEGKMSTIYILWLRQLKRYFRSRSRMIGSLGQPLMFLLALGFGLGPMYKKKPEEATICNSLPPGSFPWEFFFGGILRDGDHLGPAIRIFKRDPGGTCFPFYDHPLEEFLGGATVALIQGILVFLICLMVGFRIEALIMLPIALIFMFLIAVLCAAIGTVIASVLEDMQGFQLIMNFLIMPRVFFSNALFPLVGLTKALRVIIHLQSAQLRHRDGLRGALTHGSHFGLGIDLFILSIVTVILTGTASYLFSLIQI